MQCPRCSTENPPEYRFCGMCGNSLDKPVETEQGDHRSAEPAARQERVAPIPHSISGPSFLGLSDEPAKVSFGEPSRDVEYLLDDEEPRRTYWRFTLILMILLICGGLAWLKYSESGKAWIAPWVKQRAHTPIQASPPVVAPEAAPDNAQPAPPSENAANHNSEAAPSNPSVAANTHEQGAQPPIQQTNLPPSGQEDKAKSAQPAETIATEPAADENDKQSETASPAPATPARRAQTAKSKETPADTESADDALVANAEKALYGRGVPQNCERATSSLNAAARRENARARGLLGTMYATGHCVPRDLPTAYRWFALASRQQPNNVWVQRNLEMIWREMTPQEQQLATKLNP